jgi:AraC-like DNA-binding protein
MAKVLFFVFGGDRTAVAYWPKGKDGEVVRTDHWEEVCRVLTESGQDLDLVIMDSVPAGQKRQLSRRIKKIKDVPVIFFEENRPPAPKPERRRHPTAEFDGADGMERARLYMDEHFREPLTLGEIAARAGVSPSYFCRRFRSRFGKSPITYLSKLRLAHSRYLLANTNLAVTKVAEQSGFFAVSYFCRQFKTATGYTPVAYRQHFGNQSSGGIV